MKNIFIIVPRFDSTGPVKGAYALCNALSKTHKVQIISLKPSSLPNEIISRNIEIISLGSIPSWLERVKIYKGILRKSNNHIENVSISFCFSSDVFNSCMYKEAIIISSIRSNLFKDYLYDYGYLGALVAIVHFRLLRRFQTVIVMTKSMANQVRKISGIEPIRIGNFIDEPSLEKFRCVSENDSPIWKFIYVGSLTKRKQVDKLITALSKLSEAGYPCSLDILGKGPLEGVLKIQIKALNIEHLVKFYGHIKQPAELVSRADCLVLPSLSEGVSRAALEALFLGVPCVLRDVDGNNEIIDSNKSGILFKADSELTNALRNAARLGQAGRPNRISLLKTEFQRLNIIDSYIKLIEPPASDFK